MRSERRLRWQLRWDTGVGRVLLVLGGEELLHVHSHKGRVVVSRIEPGLVEPGNRDGRS